MIFPVVFLNVQLCIAEYKKKLPFILELNRSQLFSGLHDLGLPELVRSLSSNQLPSTVRKLPFCDWVDWHDSFRLASTESSVFTAGLGDLRLVSDLDLSSLSLFFTASKIPWKKVSDKYKLRH